MKTLTIEVTQAHIDDGEAGSCAACPVALAVSEHTASPLPIEVHVMEFVHLIDVGTGDERHLSMPAKAHAFIRAFDGEDDAIGIAPFTFDLDVTDVPPEWLRTAL